MQINTEDVFKQLKKRHGEKVAQDVRDAHLDDIPGIVHILEFAGRNRYEIQGLFPVLREVYKKPIQSEYITDQDPIQLLDMAGYHAWYVTNEQEQNAIAGYFRDKRAADKGMTGGNLRTDKNELLCTVHQNWDRGAKRFDEYYIINAVKKDVLGDDKLPESKWHIQPANSPERQDEYGTSVISIQISKHGGYISIKNRYNHTVQNPDATFNNNPDNIIPGLTNSIKRHFNVEFGTTNAEIPDHFRMVRNQFVKFNYEVNNTYFGPNYYFRASNIIQLDTNQEIMMDYFILDKKNKKLLNPADIKDPAFDILKELLDGKNIRDEKNPNNPQERIIFADGVKIASVENGQITELNLPNVKEIGDMFLQFNTALRKINMPDVKKIGKIFLTSSTLLQELNAPNLEIVGSSFLNTNLMLNKLNTPRLRNVGHDFLLQNTELTDLWLPELETAGDAFLCYNENLKSLYTPNLKIVGNSFLMKNMGLTHLVMPELEQCGFGFIYDNTQIQSVFLPNITDVDTDFLRNNVDCRVLYVPMLRHAGDNFMCINQNLTEARFPELETTGGFFLEWNEAIESLFAPKLRHVGRSFMATNKKLKHLDLPELEDAEDSPMLTTNTVLESVNIPHLTGRSRTFLMCKVANNKMPPKSSQPTVVETTIVKHDWHQ